MKQPHKLFKMAMAAVLLATFLLLLLLLPLPLPHGFPALHALHRLKDLPLFLLFTTAIVIAILHSLRPTASHAPKPSLDQFPLASIFGDVGRPDTEYYGSHPVEHPHRTQASPEAYSLSMRGARYVAGSDETTTTHRRNLSASREEGYSPAGDPGAVGTQRKKLNRRSSSLDDSINYEPAEPEEAGSTAAENLDINVGKNESDIGAARTFGTPKKVSFSVDSWGASASPEYDRKVHEYGASSPSPGGKEGQGSIGQGQGKVLMSPNEVNRQADAFIAKFKEQMRLQRLESFQRYRRRHA